MAAPETEYAAVQLQRHAPCSSASDGGEQLGDLANKLLRGLSGGLGQVVIGVGDDDR